MTQFTKEQLELINCIKKTFNLTVVWHYLEYLRIEREIGHTPSIAELCANGGETEAGTWSMSIGGLKEMGFLGKKSRVQTIEDTMWKSEFLDLLWGLVKPHMDENGFATIDHKGRAENAVKTVCDQKAKTVTEKADIIEECQTMTFKKIQNIWDAQYGQNIGSDGLPF